MYMSLNGCLSIACTSYPPRQYPESLRHPPETSQTSSRHPSVIHIIQSHSHNSQTPLRHFPDNLQTIRGTWERRNQLIKITLIRCLSINFTSYPPPPPDPTQTVSRVKQTTQDTSQISSRHTTDTSKLGTQWPIHGYREKRNQPIKIKQYSMFNQRSFAN